MTNQLPMAIKSSTTSKQHTLTNLLNCFTFVDVEKQLIIAAPIFLHLGYGEDSAQEVLSQPMVQQYTNCAGFTPREVSFISIPQIGELIINAPKTKYVSHILEFVKNTLIPLFKPQHQTQPQINADFSQENKSSQLIEIKQQIIGNESVNAVSARELHKFLESKRKFTDWVKPYVGANNDYGFVQDTDFVEVHASVNINNVAIVDYWFAVDMAKEVSMLSKTAKGKEARKYFIECEKKATIPQITTQAVAVAPAPAPTHGLPTAKDLAMMVIKSEEEKESLLIDYNFLSKELCQTIREKAQISSKREASALGKLARANDKIRQLEAQGVLNLDGEKLSLLEIANKLNVAPQALAHVISSLGIFGITWLCESQVTGHRNGKLDYDWVYTPLAVALIKQTLEKGK